MKRVFVSLPEGVWKIIYDNFQGPMGEAESEIIRNMIIAYLSDQGYFVNAKGEPAVDDIYTKLGILDKMVTSLTEVLEEKGTIRFDEWDRRVKKKIEETGDKTELR